jgi:hypothetical protein
MTARQVASALGNYWQQAVESVRRHTGLISKMPAAHLQRAWLGSRSFWVAGIIIVVIFLLVGFWVRVFLPSYAWENHLPLLVADPPRRTIAPV